jgi:hypothetical protein
MKKFNAGLLVLFLIFTFLASCDSDKAGTKSLRVRVVSFENDGLTTTRIPNATVVLGNSDGSMIAYGTTDTKGEYIFVDPPAHATVTAAFPCLQSGATYTTYSVKVIYDVNLPAITTWMNDCKTRIPLGTITINAANSISTATNWDIKLGNESYPTSSLAFQHTYTVYSSMLQSDGKLSIAVIGNDSSGQPVGYGVLPDQTFADGMTVTINVDKMMSHVQYSLNNIPSTAKSLVASIGMMHMDNSISIDSDSGGLSSAVTTTTMNVAYIPGFGDQFDYLVWGQLDQNNNGQAESFVSLGNTGPGNPPADQNFDFNQALTIPADPAVSYATGTTRPTFSWTGADSTADQMYLNVLYENSDKMFNIAWIMAAPQRTSVVFPELPASLAAYMPANVNTFSCGIWDMSAYSGYDDSLIKADQWLAEPLSMPSTGFTSRTSTAVYSSTMTYAPKLNKSNASILPMRRIMFRPY